MFISVFKRRIFIFYFQLCSIQSFPVGFVWKYLNESCGLCISFQIKIATAFISDGQSLNKDCVPGGDSSDAWEVQLSFDQWECCRTEKGQEN